MSDATNAADAILLDDDGDLSDIFPAFVNEESLFRHIFQLRYDGFFSNEQWIHNLFVMGARALTGCERWTYFGTENSADVYTILYHSATYVEKFGACAAWRITSAMADALHDIPLRDSIRTVCLRMWGVSWSLLGGDKIKSHLQAEAEELQIAQSLHQLHGGKFA